MTDIDVEYTYRPEQIVTISHYGIDVRTFDKQHDDDHDLLDARIAALEARLTAIEEEISYVEREIAE